MQHSPDPAHGFRVALRKESVDRNHVVLVVPAGCWVALRKESVDRNPSMSLRILILPGSLSARRAWIEMQDDGD